MSNSLKIGFIGSGGLARHHMAQVAQLGAHVTAIADVNRAAAEAAATDHPAAVYDDARVMLRQEALDAVYIAVPPFAHGDLELAVCEAGLPFFVEKPVAKDMATARKIEAAVAGAGLLTCVGYQLRYTATAQRLQRILADRRVGMGVGRYWCGFTQTMTGGWLIQRDLSGGQMVEQTTHLLDMIRFLAGDVTEVFGHEAKMLKGGGDCPDVNVALLKLASGGAVTVTSSWGAGDPGDWGDTNQLQLFWDGCRADWSPGSLALSPDGCGTDEADAPAARDIDAVFLDAVRSGDGSSILSPYADAVKSLAISLAIDQSAESGQPVTL